MRLAYLVAMLAITAPGLASEPAIEAITEKFRAPDYGLTSDDPNYFVWVPGGNGDKSHVQFYVSIKYPLIAWGNLPTEPDDLQEPDGLYFAYSGLYDFYVFNDEPYDSSPVISRDQNPGLFAQWSLFNDPSTKLRLGVYHQSNGQTQDENDLAEFNSNLNEFGITYAASEVSRSWNYADVLLKRLHKLPYQKHYWKLQGEARLYDSDPEDEIWWEPGNNATIGNYDGLRFVGEFSPTKRLVFRGDLQTGIRSEYVFNKITYKATLDWKVWPNQNLVLTTFYFNGYGRELSTYNLHNKYVGIGFEFRSANQD